MMIVGAQMGAAPLTETRRAEAHVDRDIENCPLEDRNQLSLCVWMLKVNAPKHPTP
jgi:hypothetical protein